MHWGTELNHGLKKKKSEKVKKREQKESMRLQVSVVMNLH